MSSARRSTLSAWSRRGLCLLLLSALAVFVALGSAASALAAAGCATPPSGFQAVSALDGDGGLTSELSTGHSVYLTADISETGSNESIPAADSVTIDLCGYSLSITDVPATVAAIEVPSTASLTIEDTSSTLVADQGSVTAQGGASDDSEPSGYGGGGAGIGGDGASEDTTLNAGGSVTIDGGTVAATGGSGGGTDGYSGAGAGIGGGGGSVSSTNSGGAGGTVTLAGGVVTATGGIGGRGGGGGGAGIGGGGGSENSNTNATGGANGSLTVSGATVIAQGGAGGTFQGGGGAGVGGGGAGDFSGGGAVGGSGGEVNVSAGTLTATGGDGDYSEDFAGGGGAGIGGGGGQHAAGGGSGGTVSLSGGTTAVTGGELISGSVATSYGAGIGGGGDGIANTSSVAAGTVTVSGSGTASLDGAVAAALTVAAGGTLDVSGDQTLLLDGSDTNNGTIELAGVIDGVGSLDNASVIETSGSAWGLGKLGYDPDPTSTFHASGYLYELAFDVNGSPSATPPDIYVFAPTVSKSGQSLPTDLTPPSSGMFFSGWLDSSDTLFTNTSPTTELGGLPATDTLTASFVPADAPVITAKLTSAHAKTSYGWYRSTVKVTFSCTGANASAALSGPCPGAVVLTKNGAQSLTRKVTAVDGESGSVTVTVKLDTTKPVVTIKGAKAGKTYSSIPHLSCSATDRYSGIASCKLSTKRKGKQVTATAVATSKAGLTATKTVSFKIK